MSFIKEVFQGVAAKIRFELTPDDQRTRQIYENFVTQWGSLLGHDASSIILRAIGGEFGPTGQVINDRTLCIGDLKRRGAKKVTLTILDSQGRTLGTARETT